MSSFDWAMALDWGTVPTWFSAIGTTGALIATIFIILSDRRESRRTDAQRVACSATSAHESGDGIVSEVTVHNIAERPIQQVHVEFHDYREELGEEIEGVSMIWPTIAPAQRVTVSLGGIALAVIFTDAGGRSWIRNLDNQSLVPNTKRRDRVRIQRAIQGLQDAIGEVIPDDQAHQLYTTRYRPPRPPGG